MKVFLEDDIIHHNNFIQTIKCIDRLSSISCHGIGRSSCNIISALLPKLISCYRPSKILENYFEISIS